MILYFSGTGNSRFVAERLAAQSADTLQSINEHLKSGEKLHCGGEKSLTFVTPIYAGRIPREMPASMRRSCAGKSRCTMEESVK